MGITDYTGGSSAVKGVTNKQKPVRIRCRVSQRNKNLRRRKKVGAFRLKNVAGGPDRPTQPKIRHTDAGDN